MQARTKRDRPNLAVRSVRSSVRMFDVVGCKAWKVVKAEVPAGGDLIC